MVAGLLEEHRIECSARGRDKLRGPTARTARVPLQERQSVLCVEKFASGQSKDGLGLFKRGERQHPRERLWESLEPRVDGHSRFAWD